MFRIELSELPTPESIHYYVFKKGKSETIRNLKNAINKMKAKRTSLIKFLRSAKHILSDFMRLFFPQKRIFSWWGIGLMLVFVLVIIAFMSRSV